MDRSPISFDRAIPSCAPTPVTVFARRHCLRDLAPELSRRLVSFVSVIPRYALRNRSASMPALINAYRATGHALALHISIRTCSGQSRSRVSSSIRLALAASADTQISRAESHEELRAML